MGWIYLFFSQFYVFTFDLNLYVVVVQIYDVNFAIRGLKKSHKAFVVANLLLQEAQDRDSITSISHLGLIGSTD